MKALLPRTLSCHAANGLRGVVGCLARPEYSCGGFRGRGASASASGGGRSAGIGSAVAIDSTACKEDVDWDNLGFGLDYNGQVMFHAEWTSDEGWQGRLQDYGPLSLMPSAQALHYGQSIFEGLKATRTAKGRVALFRPSRNAARMRDGANRLLMPVVPEEMFINALEEIVKANVEYVPPLGKGSLYIRPLLFGSGPRLGLAPAPSFTFIIFCAAVGSYFKGGQLTPIDLVVEERFHRAAPGGMGGTKAAGNYSPVLLTQRGAQAKGFADVVYLDAKTDTYLEEVSSCNIFIVKGKTLKTPPLSGTILPGVTRESILELASARGYNVEETPVSVHEALEADEVFTAGTAVVVSPVGSLTYKGKKHVYGDGKNPTPIALEIYQALTDIQTERAEDPFGWVHPVC
eukprot:evm.model.scf_3527.1 EVM.evm.TU.scf_3527.1   scf_3527:2259-7100(+)